MADRLIRETEPNPGEFPSPVPQYRNPTTGAWERTEGSGGAPKTRIEDGHDVALGATTDAAATTDTGTFSLIALVKRLLQRWTAGLDVTDRAGRLVGHVTVDNLPATQPVSGTVSVSNPPATQASTIVDGGDVTQGAKADAAATSDTGTFTLIALIKRLLQKWTAGIDVTDRVGRLVGHVTVDNLPTTQPVSGTVAVSNLPSTQSVSGNVGVSNFPATQPVSGAVAVSNLPTVQTVTGADPQAPTSLTVLSGTTIASAPIDLGARSLVALEMPTTWDGGNIVIQACSTLGGTYQDVYDSAGAVVTVTAAASRVIGLTGAHLQATASLRYIKLRTTAAPVADRTIALIAKG